MCRIESNQGSGFRVQGSEKKLYLVPRILKRGFTLVELLIATAILAVIALTIFSTFAGGINIYNRFNNYKAAQQDVLLSLEKMEWDLRNTLDYSKIDFVGDKKKVSFASLIKSPSPKNSQYEIVGRVSYYIDNLKGILIKEEENYSRATSEATTGEGNKREFAPLEDINFSYFYYNKDTKKYDWKDSWNLNKSKSLKTDDKKNQDGKFPLGVKIEVTYKNNDKQSKLVRMVFLPLAQ